MKKIIFVFAVVIAIAACGNKQAATPTSEGNVERSEVPFEVAKNYENKRIVLVNERETNYFPAIDRYLADSIGSKYAKGEHCVPIHSIVRVDERNAEDILVWGDFWVFNYNQVGDTLKCVSGGSHPGLLHIRQTEKGFEVTAFDQVEDGSRYLPTAKKIFGDKFDAFQAINSDEKNRERLRAEGLATYAKKNGLAVTLYQDYGWPAKKLEINSKTNKDETVCD